MSARLAELAEAFAEHGRLRCEPIVDRDEDVIRITVDIPNDATQDATEAYFAIQRVCDLATVRELCKRYDINPDAFVASLKEDR